MPSRVTHRFVALDGLRGVAAIAVVLFHFGGGPRIQFTHRGYLAVDFFFVLSGFVLAHAYGARLTSRDLTPRALLVLRYFRLWPMAALGTAAGVVVALRLDGGADGLTAALNFLMIPGVAGSALRFYPFNPPHWSLWYELIASYCYGVVAPLLSRAALLGLVPIAAIALAVVTLDRGTGEHFDVTRVLFAFLIGVGIQRIDLRAHFGAPVAIGLGVVVLVLCSIPRDVGPGWTDAAIALVAFPAVVALGAMTEVRGPLARIAAAGGDMSYPLYAIHFPVIRLIVTGHATPTWAIAPWTLALVALAAFLARSYDPSVRRWLTSLREERVAVAAPTAAGEDSPPAA